MRDPQLVCVCARVRVRVCMHACMRVCERERERETHLLHMAAVLISLHQVFVVELSPAEDIAPVAEVVRVVRKTVPGGTEQRENWSHEEMARGEGDRDRERERERESESESGRAVGSEGERRVEGEKGKKGGKKEGRKRGKERERGMLGGTEKEKLHVHVHVCSEDLVNHLL